MTRMILNRIKVHARLDCGLSFTGVVVQGTMTSSRLHLRLHAAKIRGNELRLCTFVDLF